MGVGKGMNKRCVAGMYQRLMRSVIVMYDEYILIKIEKIKLLQGVKKKTPKFMLIEVMGN